jgi:hypothetical protein
MSQATTVVVCVFQLQPLVLLLKCGAKAEVAEVGVVVALARMAAKVARMDGLPALSVDKTGYYVHVLVIAIVQLVPYAAEQWDSILEFANATVA